MPGLQHGQFLTSYRPARLSPYISDVSRAGAALCRPAMESHEPLMARPPDFLHIGGMAILNIKNFPDPLYRKLKRRAKLQHRSVAQEVTAILERVLTEPEPLSLLELDGLGSELWQSIDAARHVENERREWDE